MLWCSLENQPVFWNCEFSQSQFYFTTLLQKYRGFTFFLFFTRNAKYISWTYKWVNRRMDVINVVKMGSIVLICNFTLCNMQLNVFQMYLLFITFVFNFSFKDVSKAFWEKDFLFTLFTIYSILSHFTPFLNQIKQQPHPHHSEDEDEDEESGEGEFKSFSNRYLNCG